jgi:hypothetical protein
MGLREADHSGDTGLAAAVTLAELAGVDAVRLGIDEELKPVVETDVLNARRVARRFELRSRRDPIGCCSPRASATADGQVVRLIFALAPNRWRP